MTTLIKFDSDTGVTVSADARRDVMSATAPEVGTHLSGDDLIWAHALPAAAFDANAVIITPYGETTIHSFEGEVTDGELTTLRTFLHFGRAGQSATLFMDDTARGTTHLFVCNGDGTATVHVGQLVFPTYAEGVALPSRSAAIAMSFATDAWREALESEMHRLDIVDGSHAATQPARQRQKRSGALPTPTRSSLSQSEVEAGLATPAPRPARMEPHDDSPSGFDESAAPRL